jgi:hypothetical protein
MCLVGQWLRGAEKAVVAAVKVASAVNFCEIFIV